MLDHLGLTDTGVAVYRLLLRNPDLEVTELCADLLLPREQVITAMGDLKRLALIRPSWENSDKLRIVSPEIGLTALITNHDQTLADQRRQLEQVKVAVARFVADYADWRTKNNRGEVEFLVGIDATRNRIDELAASTRTEMVAFSMGTQSPDTIAAGRSVDQDALERGLHLRSIYLQSIHNHPPSKAHAQWLVEHGALVRVAPVLPLRMIIFDQRIALLPIDPDSSREGAVMLRGRGLLTALLDLFERAWESASPVDGSAPTVTTDELGETELAVLKLLAQGFTDEAVARKLDVSLRTVRRMMARLMRQLGTRSRFETGIRIAELGLL